MKNYIVTRSTKQTGKLDWQVFTDRHTAAVNMKKWQRRANEMKWNDASKPTYGIRTEELK